MSIQLIRVPISSAAALIKTRASVDPGSSISSIGVPQSFIYIYQCVTGKGLATSSLSRIFDRHICICLYVCKYDILISIPHKKSAHRLGTLPLFRKVAQNVPVQVLRPTTSLVTIAVPESNIIQYMIFSNIYVVPPQSWGDRSDTKHSKCLLLGGRRLNQLTLIPKPKGSGGARAAMAQVGPANKRSDTKRCLPVEASLRPGEAVPW